VGIGTNHDDRRWREQAACRHSDPDLFFPVGSSERTERDVRAAKAMCAACPVREACLAFALETNQDLGVWGGASEEERRQLRRQREAERRAAFARR
jgi:WhiB family redox-sensing transcriptional regulator